MGEIIDYFGNLFSSSNPTEFDPILQSIPQVITAQMNSQLTKPLTELEIQKAVFSLNPNKAPGLDGMSPIFSRNFGM